MSNSTYGRPLAECLRCCFYSPPTTLSEQSVNSLHKKLLLPLVVVTLVAGLAGPVSAYADDWQDQGGIFNPPSEIFNADHAGYGSSGQTIYNKIDLRNGKQMEIEEGTVIHDSEGNVIGIAEGSGIGYYNGERDGGLVAGSLAQMELGNRTVWATYVWSVDIDGKGRMSGWVDVAALGNAADSSVEGEIFDVLKDTHDARIDIFEDELLRGDYEAFEVVDYRLPSYMEEYYLDPDRDPSSLAGKAKYYYTRDGLLTVSMNIPETGSQRYGVGNNIVPEGAVFYRDMNVDRQTVNIYPPSSSDASSHSLRLVWGYFETTAGAKVYSWTNERVLQESTAAPAPAPEPSTAVTVFADAGFGGASLDLGVGSHYIDVLRASAVGNDNISSIRIADGYSVRACQHGSPTRLGTCEVYDSSMSNLSVLDNEISGLVVNVSSSLTAMEFVSGTSHWQ